MYTLRLTCKECGELLQESRIVTKEIDVDVAQAVSVCQQCRDRAIMAAYQEGYEAGVEEGG